MPTKPRRPSGRTTNQRSDVRDAALALFAERGYRTTGVRDISDALGIGTTSVYSHISSKAELLREIVLGTLDAALSIQADAIASTTDVVDQLRRVAESQVRYFTQCPQEAIVTTRDFMWAESDDLKEILTRRQTYLHRVEELLGRGHDEGRFVVENSKIAAFAIIEMCEAVPKWFRADNELSATQIAYLYGEYAVRIAGAGGPPS
ncbi:TetR/AcrR family transcriptional regulator [Streptomyces sp. GbtcB7]|uniref:TetR/AcrR family transcriptional regulator n=1 Tax=Streptomyces sp. GbtcB7 TaxID=2824752 RepID=UPI001C2F400D|nr:TetR/AcrR family transcriptional regulator [Streptomyces sp. GbtcB7]